MKVDTYLYGSVDVNPDNVITFPNGLVGFESSKRYMLVHEQEKNDAASFTLQSIDQPTLAFQIIDPTAVGFNYELALTDAETELLQNPAAEDVAVMIILFKPDVGKADIKPNLRAPLLINTRAKLGLQKVMEKMHQNVMLSNLASPV